MCFVMGKLGFKFKAKNKNKNKNKEAVPNVVIAKSSISYHSDDEHLTNKRSTSKELCCAAATM